MKIIGYVDFLITTFELSALEILKGSHVELTMKDNNTLGGSKYNAIRWCQIAKEEVDRL